jgi:hypothetical protein
MAAARKRHDPISRDADGRSNWDDIVNKDPDRHYALVDPNDRFSGLNSYLRRGYIVEEHRTDGPKVAGEWQAKGDGNEVRSGDLVLVSRTMAIHEAEQKRLAKPADQIERQILKEENVDDGLRGRTGVRFRSLDDANDSPFPD